MRGGGAAFRGMLSSGLPEARLLMLAGAPDSSVDELADLAEGGLDWERLIALAAFERAFPVVADQIAAAGVRVPEPFASRLRAYAAVADFSITGLHALLDGIGHALANAGIEFVLLKGAALGRTCYDRPRSRPLGDLDVLVRESELIPARDALIGVGWRYAERPELAGFYARHHHLPPLHDPAGAGARLEVHWDLFFRGNPFAFGADDVWRQRRVVSVGGVEAFVPGANHLLLHACLHFSWGHMLREGAWTAFRDVAVLAASGAVGWEEFVREARQARAATASYWTLALAKHFAGARVPGWVLGTLTPPRSGRMLRALERHFQAGVLGAPRPPRRLERLVWEVAMAPRASGHGTVRPWEHDEEFVVRSVGAGGVEPRTPVAVLETLGHSTNAAARCVLELALGGLSRRD